MNEADDGEKAHHGHVRPMRSLQNSYYVRGCKARVIAGRNDATLYQLDWLWQSFFHPRREFKKFASPSLLPVTHEILLAPNDPSPVGAAEGKSLLLFSRSDCLSPALAVYTTCKLKCPSSSSPTSHKLPYYPIITQSLRAVPQYIFSFSLPVHSPSSFHIRR